jgi:hypothetical protein
MSIGLRSAWQLVASTPIGPGLRAAQIEGHDGIWATVSDKAEHGLLVVVGPSQKLGATVAAVKRAATALGAEIYPFSNNGQPARGLLITCASQELLDAFAGFCEPFVDRCKRGEDVEKAFWICFEEFRRLVALGSDEELPARILGLLGELFVLDEAVNHSVDAIRSWSYPALDRHDFRNGAVAMEVKTTLRSKQSRRVISVNAVDQLEPPDGGALFLHWLAVEHNPSGALSISKLIESISDRLPAIDALSWRSRFTTDADLDAIANRSFSLLAREAYIVDHTFPRLTSSKLVRGALDPGISKVHYELDLSAAEGNRVDSVSAVKRFIAGV